MAEKPRGPQHMTPDEFRRHGRDVVEWLARYMEEVERYPVKSQVAPGEVAAAMAASPPDEPMGFDGALDELEQVVVPGLTHWQSPSFFAYFPANTSGPSILGDLLAAGLGVQGMLWETSPACTEVETRMLDWTAELLGLPERFRSTSLGGGVLQDSASSAALCAILAARERSLGGASNREGLADCAETLVAYTSSQAHSSIEKSIRIAGLGSKNLRRIRVDERFAMDPEALTEAMNADRAAGRRPFFVCATVGTTATGAFDPIARIAEACRDHGAWLHADGAMFGTAAVCPEHRWIHEGLEHADSYCFNPHKWMLTGFDCDCFWVADRQALIGALSILPHYLQNAASESGRVIDYRDWQVPLGRRFRSLKLWLVLRWYGASGLQALVRHHLALTKTLAVRIADEPRLTIAAPHPFNLLCFHHRDGNEATQAIMDRINASGAGYLSHAMLGERLVARISVGQAHTEARHVDALWQAIEAAL
jgi:aromatic-L-amino-acid/L-tryptophan decarboxylase